MDSSLKQRLVGIAVIFALAVIFLPMILDGSGIKERNLVVDIPQPPVVKGNPEFKEKILELDERAAAIPTLTSRFVDEQTPAIEPDNVVAKADDIAESESKTTSKAQNKSEKVETPGKELAEKKSTEKQARQKPKSGGESWVLQAASFADREKATRQRDKLRKSKVAAVFIEAFENDSKVSYRVRLGPFLSKDEARIAQNKIKAKHNISGLVMKYER